MENLRQSLEYLVGLGKDQVKTFEIGGHTYATDSLNHIRPPKLPTTQAVGLSTLTGVVDYVKSSIDKIIETLLIHVTSYNQVKIFSPLKSDFERDTYIISTAQTPRLTFDQFLDPENFNIMLQSGFLDNDDKPIILKVVGNIKEENVRTTGDDGISQVVTAKVGIANVSDVLVPNPVVLRPFRTFTEVEQPESRFVFRMKDGPRAALFEADGGAWKLEAMLNIKEYLEKALEGCNVKIIA
jgi:hypothetical protein